MRMKKEKIIQTQMPIIGTNIKRLREERNLKNAEVVRNLQIKGCTISAPILTKIETGINNPSVEILIGLAELFDCSFDEFFQPIESEHK